MAVIKTLDGRVARSLETLAAEALAVQDACNLSGVVYGWARAMDDLNAYRHHWGLGTDWMNNHCINVLWADKVADLSKAHTFSVTNDAYAMCEKFKAGIEEPVTC